MDRSRARLEDLLIQRSLEGITETEARELRALLAEHPDVDPDAFDRATAAIAASQAPVFEEMPASLYRRIEAAGVAMVARKSQ